MTFDPPIIDTPIFDTPKVILPTFDTTKFDPLTFDTPTLGIQKCDTRKFDTSDVWFPKTIFHFKQRSNKVGIAYVSKLTCKYVSQERSNMYEEKKLYYILVFPPFTTVADTAHSFQRQPFNKTQYSLQIQSGTLSLNCLIHKKCKNAFSNGPLPGGPARPATDSRYPVTGDGSGSAGLGARAG